MTHLQRFLDLLNDMDVSVDRTDYADGSTMIQLGNVGGVGYTGFVSDWTFDANGRFLSLAHWE